MNHKSFAENIKYYAQVVNYFLLFALLFPIIWLGEQMFGDRFWGVAR